MTLDSQEWTDDLGKVTPQTTVEKIADQIRAAIMRGRLHTGTQLSETMLADLLGVSRGPVRESLQRLTQEGLITRGSNRSLYVASFSGDDVADVYFARTAIESAAITKLLRTGVEPALRELRKCVTTMRNAAALDDRQTFTNADLDFHSALVGASGSARLRRMQRTLLLETRLCMTRLEGVYGDVSEIVTEHSDLVAAMEQGDLPRALDVLEGHMSYAVVLLRTEAGPGADPDDSS